MRVSNATVRVSFAKRILRGFVLSRAVWKLSVLELLFWLAVGVLVLARMGVSWLAS
jgi:hypothetical protein